MKKSMKIVAIIALLLILVNTCIDTFAVEIQPSNAKNQVVTKEKLKESLTGYTNGTKKATAKVGNTTYTVGDGNDPMEIVVTDETIEIDGFVYKYTIENSKVKFSYDIEVKDGDSEYINKLLQYMLFPTLFISVTDLYEIDSNKALYYYESIYEANRKTMETIPADVDINNGLSYMKFLRTTTQFKEINNTVFKVNYEILEDSDTTFKCVDNLVINLDKVNTIIDFDETSYEMSNKVKNTNTEEPVVAGVENKIENKVNTNTNKNTNTNTALPYSGLEDENTFISVALISIGISLIFYAKYATLRIKEN